MKRLWAILLLVGSFGALASEVIPQAPKQYFNDYAHVVSPGVAAQLNQTLEQFERDSSDQIVVAIYPKMQSDSSIEEYTVRVARGWQVGQKDKNNGAVLFVFVQDHKMFLQVGYGLEGVLPDATCKRIISDQIAPHFKSGDYDGGMVSGVQSIIAAARGEYKGTGQTVVESRGYSSSSDSGPQLLPVLFIGFIFLIILMAMLGGGRRRRGFFYTGGGWSSGGWGGGSSWGGGGGGGGGGFSGGGGSFGGGGAGGSW